MMTLALGATIDPWTSAHGLRFFVINGSWRQLLHAPFGFCPSDLCAENPPTRIIVDRIAMPGFYWGISKAMPHKSCPIAWQFQNNYPAGRVFEKAYIKCAVFPLLVQVLNCAIQCDCHFEAPGQEYVDGLLLVARPS